MRAHLAALLLFVIGVVATPAAVASSPLTFVRDIPLPQHALPIGLISFPAGSIGGVSYPAQRIMVTDEAIYVLPARGSDADISLLWNLPVSLGEFLSPTLSTAAGWVRPDGTRELVISAKPHRIFQFNLEDGTVISSVDTGPLVPGENSLQVDRAGNGFVLRSDLLLSLDITSGATASLPTAGIGSGNGQLSGSTAMAIGPDGLLDVLDLGNNRIEAFTSAGDYVRQVPLAPNTIGDGQLAVGADGRFYVGDDNGGGAVYDASGSFLGTYSTASTNNLRAPSRALISVDADGSVLEIEYAGTTIHEFVPSVPTIAQVIAEVQASGLNQGISTSLVFRLQNAKASLDAGYNTAARNQLQAFIYEVAALQASGSLAPATAAKLTADAQAVINSIQS